MAVGLGSISGPPEVSLAQAEALGKVEQGDLLGDHDLIEDALASFDEAQQLLPELHIPASSWNHLCIRGIVLGYLADVKEACELAVSLVQKDDSLLFGLEILLMKLNSITGSNG